METSIIWLLILAALILPPALVLGIRVAIGVKQARDRKRKPLVCTACGKTDVRPSWQSGIADRLLVWNGYVPYRCRACSFRFYRHRRDIGNIPALTSD